MLFVDPEGFEPVRSPLVRVDLLNGIFIKNENGPSPAKGRPSQCVLKIKMDPEGFEPVRSPLVRADLLNVF